MAVSLSWRLARLVAALLIVAACASGDRPTAPRPRPEFAISDGIHEGGTPGFYFLPPMVSQPAFSGTFDADITTINPQIAICDITNSPDDNCGGAGGTSAVIVFTTTSTPAITVDLTAPQYQVNWNTRGAGFVAGNTYRVHVTAGASGARRELGFADVLLTTTPGQAKKDATGDLIVLKDGRPLPIHFRIETGIAGSVSVSAATPSVATGGTDLLTATVQDLHGAPLVGATVAWTVSAAPGVVASLAPASGPADAGGQATTLLTAGTTPGTAVVAVTSAGVSATATVAVVGVAFTALEAGDRQSCAIATNGVTYCWGSDEVGQLGDGGTVDRFVPGAVSGGLSFATISSSFEHTCALGTEGQVSCWGRNEQGQLGDGTTTNSSTPVAVASALTFTAVTSGGIHTCALTTNGAAYCWGDNSLGQLGTGDKVSSGTPVAVSGGMAFASISAGFFHTCGLTAAGAAFCWGFGGLGNAISTVPVAVSGGLTFVAVTSGSLYTCALTAAGAAYCWGNNASGQLGFGPATLTDVALPTPVSGGVSFVSLSADNQNDIFDHTCGITAQDVVYCWGENVAGELGAPTSEMCPGFFGTNPPHACSTTPIVVSGGLLFTKVAAGIDHTCGISTTGQLYCWGGNGNGQLGNGTTTPSTTPVLVSGSASTP
jgi:alpha-tubulin suppressor-like RCC1 family protein